VPVFVHRRRAGRAAARTHHWIPAAAAAGLRLDLTLAAAADESRDGLHATARGLLGRGVAELPAIRVGRRWFSGDQGLLEASAAMRRPAFASGPPLAPAG
jgi:2-hydroxychromene-2-carboxylate isomerase